MQGAGRKALHLHGPDSHEYLHEVTPEETLKRWQRLSRPLLKSCSPWRNFGAGKFQLQNLRLLNRGGRRVWWALVPLEHVHQFLLKRSPGHLPGNTLRLPAPDARATERVGMTAEWSQTEKEAESIRNQVIESRGHELAGWRTEYARSCYIDFLFFHF